MQANNLVRDGEGTAHAIEECRRQCDQLEPVLE